MNSPMSSRPPFLFIGGAPRSGTTLLARLLDGHSRLLVFPVEHSTFERAHERRGSSPSDRAAYFRTRFLCDRSQGQQTLLASDRLLREYRLRMHSEFGIEFNLELNAERFAAVYLRTLPTDPELPRDVLHALGDALEASVSRVERVRDRASGAAYRVFKQPFYTELHAQETAARMPDVRFIHMVRHPQARYASAKKRRIDKKGGVCPRANGEVFVTALAEMSVASLHTGLANREMLGRDRYRFIRFEDLVADIDATIGAALDWLGLTTERGSRTPSHLGTPSESGSSFGSSTRVDDTALSRNRELEELTTLAERQFHDYLIGLSEYRAFYDLPEADLRHYARRWPLPFAFERRRDHAWRLLTARAQRPCDPGALAERLSTRLPLLARENGQVENT